MRAESAQAPVASSGLRTRLLSLATLIAFLSAVLFVAHEVYRALTDSFIAPIILSPDNEVVLQAKLKAGDLYTERAKALAQRDALAGEIIAGAEAIDRLRALVPLAADGVGETLERERLLLEHMVRQQQGFVGQASANLAAQLITETDLARETQALAQVRVALLENGRALAESRLSREERLTRVELEVTRLETELRSKRAERDLLAEKLAMLDELEAQLRDRPVYQAMSRSLEVAFVPYTQIDDVAEGNAVYDCLWGLLFCEPVGSLGEFVPGEVVLTDPWGNPARGQYAVLELSEREAARSKSLRVRPSELPITARHMASR